jgi:predicted nucleotidyltransferase
MESSIMAIEEGEMSTDVEQCLGVKREEILKIAAKHGASNVRIFRSFARGDEHLKSDVDFLLELEASRTLIDQVALIQDLEQLLGRPVDVAEPEGLHWSIRDKVLAEAVFV